MSDEAATEKKGPKGPLNVKSIQRRASRIKALEDQKKARRTRAKLYEEVLQAIAGGSAKNPTKFAAAALEAAGQTKGGGGKADA